MDPGPERESHFRDISSRVLREWKSDRSNMASYWREFFGDGLADSSQNFVEKVAENLTSASAPGTAGGATGAALAGAAGAGVATVATSAVFGAGVGLAIGIVSHGAKSYFRMRRAARQSPYRYLTLIEDAGVVFRSDPGAAPNHHRPS